MKKIIMLLALSLGIHAHADIIEISNIEDIKPYITSRSLCLFDIDDTLIDNQTNLGSSPWRSWAKPNMPKLNIDFSLYDGLTLFLAKSIPYKAVEQGTASLISDLQNAGITALAFTSRGRSEWYSTTLAGVDLFTQQQLQHAGIDFSKTHIPEAFSHLDPKFFYSGIIFAKHIPKGELFKILAAGFEYLPEHVVFVDDKLEQVESMQKAAEEAGIPFYGFWYRRSELNRSNFHPLAAAIQLDSFLLQGKVLSDEEVEVIIAEYIDPVAYFHEILKKTDLEKLRPSLP